MLTAIEIENFKAFGERQRVELRPITLLFGPNSGGKSSITHALHYLREIIVEGNIDAHRTWSGGDVLDLGGIRNFVHGRTFGKPICFKAELSIDGEDLPNYFNIPELEDLRNDQHEYDIRRRIKSIGIELEIATNGAPILSRYSVEINGVPFADLIAERSKPHFEIRSINWFHPALLSLDAEVELAKTHKELTELLNTKEESLRATGSNEELQKVLKQIQEHRRSGLCGALADLFVEAGEEPSLDQIIHIPRRHSILPDLGAQLEIPALANRTDSDQTDSAIEFATLLSTLLLGPGAILRHHLLGFKYIGPLRTMPNRFPEPQNKSVPSNWANGVGVWRELTSNGSLREEVSRWLNSKELLDTGYCLEMQSYKQVPTDIATLMSDPDYVDRKDFLAGIIQELPEHSRIMLRDVERNLLLQLQDVGVGLSQVIPVLGTLLDVNSFLVAVEQPELHLHPCQQAALGDVLISGIHIDCNRIQLIETHSEHLILRLLRRRREGVRKQIPEDQSFWPTELRVHYVNREGTQSRVQTIDIDVNGDFVDPWPDDFFEQDFKERFS